MKDYILVVEDQSSTRTIIKDMLNKYAVLEADNASDGFNIALQYYPKAIIVDLYLKKSSGFDLIKAVIENESTRHIPIIVATAHCKDENAEKAYKLGASEVISKPPVPHILIATVDKLVSSNSAKKWHGIGKNKPLIFLCDDTPSEISIMVEMLGESFDTMVATSAEKAIDILSSDSCSMPDLFILDAVLGKGMSGLELAGYLKGSKRFYTVPIFINTNALDMIEDEIEAIKIGIDGYFRKNRNSSAVVVAKINRVLGLHCQR